MTKCEYLTARCPFGCEVWLHAKAVAPHQGRCPRRPWTDKRRPPNEVLLADDAAECARRVCPPELLRGPKLSFDRLLTPTPGMRLGDAVTGGVVVRSPLLAVTGRRWWAVIRAAAERGEPLDPACGIDEFERVEQHLELGDHFVRCDVCGDDVSRRGLRGHQKSNSVCRFLANVAEVHTFWDLGYRDPHRLAAQGVPITWTELNRRVSWRNRLHVIRFRLWTAVLISSS